MPYLIKPLLRLIAPTFMVLTALYASFNFNQVIAQYHELVVTIPYFVLGIGLLLALQFNRLRLFSASLICLLSYFAIQAGLQQSLSNPKVDLLYTALSLAIPANLLGIVFIPENGLRSRVGSLTLALLAVQTGAVYWLYDSSWQIPLDYQFWLGLNPSPTYLLSLAASGLFAGAALLLLTLLLLRNRDIESLLLTCLIATFLTLIYFSQPFISSILLGTCGCILIYGVFHSSYDMAFRDDLTGLRNRRAFNEKLRTLGRRYVIATMDVDHFKKFNDTHGHDVGDDVLKLVAAKISEIGGGGIPYRYGGEEFCIVFANKGIEACAPHLEAVRLSIANYKMVIRNTKDRPVSNKVGKSLRNPKTTTKTTNVTISIGVAERDDTLISPELVLKASDTALYKAKKSGRNCLASAHN